MSKTSVKKINSVVMPKKRILFLGYDKLETKIIDALIKSGCEVYHTNQEVRAFDCDLAVSFGYTHILKSTFLENIKYPILNLHISYLPYNRGKHPNFWSFFENTPSGVTIHLIDSGIDTGPIMFQKYVNFDKGEKTFRETYNRLIDEIETLFLDNLDCILDGTWSAKPQHGTGTFHTAKDLPDEFAGWDSVIEHEIKRLAKILGPQK